MIFADDLWLLLLISHIRETLLLLSLCGHEHQMFDLCTISQANLSHETKKSFPVQRACSFQSSFPSDPVCGSENEGVSFFIFTYCKYLWSSVISNEHSTANPPRESAPSARCTLFLQWPQLMTLTHTQLGEAKVPCSHTQVSNVDIQVHGTWYCKWPPLYLSTQYLGPSLEWGPQYVLQMSNKASKVQIVNDLSRWPKRWPRHRPTDTNDDLSPTLWERDTRIGGVHSMQQPPACAYEAAWKDADDEDGSSDLSLSLSLQYVERE